MRLMMTSTRNTPTSSGCSWEKTVSTRNSSMSLPGRVDSSLGNSSVIRRIEDRSVALTYPKRYLQRVHTLEPTRATSHARTHSRIRTHSHTRIHSHARRRAPVRQGAEACRPRPFSRT